jgi:hypothetical protein
MIIDLLDKLLDRCIQLVQRNENLDKRLFQEYVEPIFSDFEKVHQVYLDTFRQYRAVLKESTLPFTTAHPIFDSIGEDIVFTAGQRSKVWELITKEDDSLFSEFTLSLFQYLMDREEVDASIDGNVYRDGLIEWLMYEFERDAGEAVKKCEALRHLDRTVLKMQLQYAKVVSQYSMLRKELLNY